VLAALFVPGLAIAYRYGQGELGARPLDEAIHEVGDWAIRLVFLSLAVSPARRILDWPRLALLRRMIGVAAFAYAVAHLALFAADQGFDLAKVAGEIARRVYLAVGFAALLILAALAATSTDAMVRRMGGRERRRLHRLIYAGALLALLHFFMQSAAAVREPWIMTGLFAWLLGYRLLARRWGSERRLPPLSLGALGLAAALGTALGEALYFALKTGVDPLRVLAADVTFAAGVRPGWVVLALALALTALSVIRKQKLDCMIVDRR
jgi:sulfoxide reductase heme-binding subunit YedZ